MLQHRPAELEQGPSGTASAPCAGGTLCYLLCVAGARRAPKVFFTSRRMFQRRPAQLKPRPSDTAAVPCAGGASYLLLCVAGARRAPETIFAGSRVFEHRLTPLEGAQPLRTQGGGTFLRRRAQLSLCTCWRARGTRRNFFEHIIIFIPKLKNISS